MPRDVEGRQIKHPLISEDYIPEPPAIDDIESESSFGDSDTDSAGQKRAREEDAPVVAPKKRQATRKVSISKAASKIAECGHDLSGPRRIADTLAEDAENESDHAYGGPIPSAEEDPEVATEAPATEAVAPAAIPPPAPLKPKFNFGRPARLVIPTLFALVFINRLVYAKR